jgi:hypothetical protein
VLGGVSQQLFLVETSRSESQMVAALSSPDFDLSPTYFFLMGLALENLAKAILISRDASRFVDTKGLNLDTKGLNHNLLELSRECGVPMGSHRTRVIEMLEVALKWSGRYPIPKRRHLFRQHQDKSPPGAIPTERRNDVERLYSDLLALVGTPTSSSE